MLTKQDLIRYGRQIKYPGFGEEGQEKLKAAHVAVMGVGGLGCAASLYLAYAGIGHITIVDSDSVELSNLNRQMLHWEQDVKERKTASAARKLASINSSITITPVCDSIAKENVHDMIKGVDVVVDGLDNFKTRFIVNEACVKQGVPFVHAGVSGLFGEITTIIPGKTPCLACIYPSFSEGKDIIPVFGITPALMASLQVTEVIKLIAGFGKTLSGRMLYIDSETMEFFVEDLAKDPACAVCGAKRK